MSTLADNAMAGSKDIFNDGPSAGKNPCVEYGVSGAAGQHRMIRVQYNHIRPHARLKRPYGLSEGYGTTLQR